ncbi:hypothetical protein D6C86_08950 [Aureobasidium pullulans]|uniref:BTB domain-containing protein n=1 Tax=Aureobasidium pullulans TaxID=5580 RepID=A0A4S9VTT5_AURPU|nr:hypothetical protein D6D10_06731 [Aureobasidium pullulans]THZ48306.1 hypothetical protein D6C87_00778 [Aureobasidium pullulans]THZ55067.1 hypothetical protein D6C86_08950 [Aureobasidium pullulans]
MAVTIEGKNDCDCALYNNSEDCDIILKFGEHKIYAHKLVLRMWSPFFSNTFKSRFAVATNPVFLLDDQDDNFAAVSAMVKHMYGMSYGKHPLNTGKLELKDDHITYWEQAIYHQLAVYTAADKYDCPAVRRAALELMNIYLGITASSTLDPPAVVRKLSFFIPLNALISKICGPDAPKLADQSLYTDTAKFCVRWHPRLIYHAEYRAAFQKKALYDATSHEKMYEAHITYLEGKQGINRL